MTLRKNASLHSGIAKLRDELPLPSNIYKTCEAFVCSLYRSAKIPESTADQLRYWMFCQKNQKSESLPPTTDSLHHHIERCNYQALVWKRSLDAVQALPTSSGRHGWELQGENLEVFLMSKEPASKGLLELTVCKCKKSGCKRGDVCPCRANEMSCTKACLCMSVTIPSKFSLMISQMMKTMADRTMCASLLSPIHVMRLTVLKVNVKLLPFKVVL